MIIKPPKRLKKALMGVMLEDGKVLGEWGRTSVAESPKEAIIYAHSHTSTFALVREGLGEARYWRKRYVGYRFDGRTIHSARDILASLDPEESLDALITWKNWAEAFGANCHSITGTARSLWRASLPANLLIVSGRMPVPTDGFHIGGRQEGEAGVYEFGALWDIRSAYLSTMRELWVGARYRRYSDGAIPASGVGFARATVTLPKGAPFGVLPGKTRRGTMVFPKSGTFEGMFDLSELRTAVTLTAKVDVHEAWVGRGLRLPWHRWSDNVETGYELPGQAARLVKVMANSLWGTFAVSGRGAWIRYERKRPITTLDEKEVTPPCKALSVHVASHMRTRLLLEALHFNGDDVIAAHTDGVLLHPSRTPSYRVGENVGEWGLRDIGENIVLLTPTAYSYVREDGKRRYVMAGTPPAFRERVFKSMLRKYDGRNSSSLVSSL